MWELKNIRVREAKPRDLGLFKRLQTAFLKDPENTGLLVSNSEQTTKFFEDLFNKYVESKDGFILFVAEKGIVVVGKLESAVTFKLGNLATIWTAYVTEDGRDKGIEAALLAAVKTRLKNSGYDGVTFSSPSVGKWVEEAESAGFQPFMLHHVLSLKDPK